ncbi:MULTISPECIES: YkvA family protein [Thermoactinomyces]|uniref:DUF1232 domain-containing protein n=1 Tax=Thermoactinomyces daqus TaxID=1329516 RepID=A0A7W1X846_9BACL|nr:MULTISPECIES: DUF1232 domain-containing protein [Thermoactinomyces]MBA4541744.1 DUF1232 domain-containing protein [Thermoactinomyces daqus]MBH8597170.1 DUF1232 domain-containing protein [Thermoactinomyces sp. CICC 10523]MBH8602730.1 DUF1232 domain-containing protein [Thermoactinomyces sp. CICC 10522]MBH8606160.1 DUF1232 domain-containing protein [Thermoactinomyces sp. CICC 10521]
MQGKNRKIVQTLKKLKQRSLTDEGERTVLDQFNQKVERAGGIEALIEKLKVMYQYFRDPHVSKTKKGLVGAALLYFILPTDVVADWIPVAGYLDDMTAALLVWRLLSKELELFAQKSIQNDSAKR